MLRYLVPGLLLSEGGAAVRLTRARLHPWLAHLRVCGYSAKPGPWEEMGLGGTKPTELGGGGG